MTELQGRTEGYTVIMKKERKHEGQIEHICPHGTTRARPGPGKALDKKSVSQRRYVYYTV